MLLVAHTNVAIAERYTIYAYLVSLKKYWAICFLKTIKNRKTTTDVHNVNEKAVEQIFFLYSSSYFSKNIRYIASYIPITANALANDTTVLDRSLNPK